MVSCRACGASATALTGLRGESGQTDEILLDFRAAAISVTEFPRRYVARRDPGEGIRVCAVRQKGVLLFQLDDQTHIVRVLRAFYGGADYSALFHGENED